MNILGYKIYTKELSIDLNKKLIINTINPHSYCVAKKDKLFKFSLLNSDILLPDGIGFTIASKLIKNKNINRITGSDLHNYLLNKLNYNNNGKVFYLGSTKTTINKLVSNVGSNFKNLLIDGFSPPFKDKFSLEDNNMMISKINDFKPDILFVGMTAPKQEKWVYQNKEKINVKIICSIGAVFDFYVGNINRAPKWMMDNGLEWLHRSLKNPKKLGLRNLKSNPVFIFDVLKKLLI